jgi:hypothetical protein
MAAVHRVAPETDPFPRIGPDPSASDVRPGTRWLLRAFAVLTSLAVVTLLVFPERAQEAFAWSIAMQVTAAWPGAAYASGAGLSVPALRRRRWDEIRVAVVTVGVFTALTLVATLVHTHRMHLVQGTEAGQVAAWVWFGVYLVVPVACAAVVVLQEVGRGTAREVGRPLPRWLARLLAAQGTGALAGRAGCRRGAGRPGARPAPPAGPGGDVHAVRSAAAGRAGALPGRRRPGEPVGVGLRRGLRRRHRDRGLRHVGGPARTPAGPHRRRRAGPDRGPGPRGLLSREDA